jgi:uncharacterized protein YjbJ (UPF0337 family)
MAINTQALQGQWNQLRGQVKEKWGQLTDDDLTVTGGNFDQLVGKIQQRTGEGREAIEKFFNELTSRSAGGVSQVAETAREYASQAGEYVQRAGDRFRQNYGQVGDAARAHYDEAEDLVRQNPGQSVAVAFGIGVVVGVVVGLAFRSR